jgi:hypothetical protein
MSTRDRRGNRCQTGLVKPSVSFQGFFPWWQAAVAPATHLMFTMINSAWLRVRRNGVQQLSVIKTGGSSTQGGLDKLLNN